MFRKIQNYVNIHKNEISTIKNVAVNLGHASKKDSSGLERVSAIVSAIVNFTEYISNSKNNKSKSVFLEKFPQVITNCIIRSLKIEHIKDICFIYDSNQVYHNASRQEAHLEVINITLINDVVFRLSFYSEDTAILINNSLSANTLAEKIEFIKNVSSNKKNEAIINSDRTTYNQFLNFIKINILNFKDAYVTLYANPETATNHFDIRKNDFYKPLYSNLAENLSIKIKKYIDEGIVRSILLNGAAGTGKSSALSYIVDKLNLKTIRLGSNIIGLDTIKDNLFEFIEIMSPEAVIIDDVDRIDMKAHLDFIEFLHAKVKLILFTSNSRESIDKAILRPGRIDESIQVDKLEDDLILTLLGDYSDAFERVKHMPIAFINEYIIRRRLESEEAADKVIEQHSKDNSLKFHTVEENYE